MRNENLVRFLTFGAIALVLLIFSFSLRGRIWPTGIVETDDAQVDGHLAPISAKVSGNIVEVAIDDNQQVRENDLLVRIDPRDYEVRVAQARAAVMVAQSQANTARLNLPYTRDTLTSGTSGADAQLGADASDAGRAETAYRQASTAAISVAKANVAARQATYERTQADLARMRPLAERREISKLQLDSFFAADRVAESELTAAREQLTAAEQSAEIAKQAVSVAQSRVEKSRAAVRESKARESQVPIRQAEYETAQANVEQAKANLHQAELQLSYTTLLAPIHGLVTRKTVELGQIVQPGQSMLMLVPLDQVWVTANFKETQLAQVQPGQKAKIQIDMTGAEVSGTVDSVAAATGSKQALLPPENATGNWVKVVQRIPVKIRVSPDEVKRGNLRPGMNVRASIQIQ